MSIVTIDANCDLRADSAAFLKSPSGINCTFIKFGKTGLKCYKSERLCNRSYANQLAIADVGLAPKVGFKTTVTINMGGVDCTYYAHETDIVEDIFDRAYYKGLRENGEHDKAFTYYDRFRDAANELSYDLRGHGVTWLDNHPGNVGFDCNGNAVIIDCADDLFGGGYVESS